MLVLTLFFLACPILIPFIEESILSLSVSVDSN